MKHITVNEIKQMTGSDGLILQGCGGDPAEWLNGINEMLTESGILRNGGAFTDVYVFEHNGLTNILYPFDNINPDNLDMGRLAMWRLQTRDSFGGVWLSDYQQNQLGMHHDLQHEEKEPTPPIVAFGERRSTYRDKLYSEEPHENDPINEAPYKPFRLYIENIHDSTTGGFTIPMPTTYEELRPFLEGAEISGLHDMRIWEIRSEINGLGNAMYDHVAKVMTPELFDELNFLAHRLSQLANLYPPHYQVIDMHLEAVLEAKRHIGSIAEIINLTENLEKFEILPAFDARSYGEALAEIDADAHYMGIDALRNSGDKNLVDLVSYIEKLEKNLDHKAYGKSAMKEEDGVFTRNGYLLWEGAEFITPYNGQQDIPVEYRVFTDPDEVIRPILKVKSAGIAETLIKLHAVCNDRMCAADVIRPIIAGESKDYLMSINGYDDLRLFDAMDAYKRGSEAFKVFTLGR